MKLICYVFCVIFLFGSCAVSQHKNLTKDQQDLARTTAAIRDAFGRGDIAAILSLHHPKVIKAFGGNNYINGRDAMVEGLTESFKTTTMEFVENEIENTLINGDTAIETSIFTIKAMPKNGGPATFSRGRSMVVYIRYNGSPTGWASIREMAQAAPDKK